MILDLHAHSVRSDDGRARVGAYCQWIRTRRLALDGFVLTEHRQFDTGSEYRPFEDEFGLRILKGSELETDYGHVLVFGVNEDLRARVDFGAVDLRLDELLREVERAGAVAVPCHPGRPRVGLCSHYETRGPLDGVRVIETRNGGSRSGEDEAAQALATRFGYGGIGGSDAHLVSHIGRCATRFRRVIHSAEQLAAALREGEHEAVSWPWNGSTRA
jgi:predicted metal-dependent phosphoesterase TrpH